MFREKPMIQISEDLTLLEESIERTIEKISPLAKVQRLDAEKRFDEDLYDGLRELGVWGLGVEERDGGSGGTNLEQIVALRVLASRATSMAVFGVVQFLLTRLLKDNGNDEQRRAILAPLATGEKKGSFCLTEARGGNRHLARDEDKGATRWRGLHNRRGEDVDQRSHDLRFLHRPRADLAREDRRRVHAPRPE